MMAALQALLIYSALPVGLVVIAATVRERVL